MAKSNRDRVGDLMDTLREGLGPFVLREYYSVYGAAQFMGEVAEAVSSPGYPPPALPDANAALTAIDTQGWLNLMSRRWNEVFKLKLGKSERSYVGELQDARNDWAHQNAFTNDAAYRAADTAARLLEAVNAPEQSQACRAIANELLRLKYDDEQKKATKTAAQVMEMPGTTTGLKPWRQVIQPHDDVAQGRYAQAEFAADLAQVVRGEADPEYGDPREFFRRTFLTEGLVDLLATGLKRLNGEAGDPVVQLKTSFGGGKTHSMLALYHLFGGKLTFNDIPDGEKILQRAGTSSDPIRANRAVIVGTAFSASQPRHYKDCTTHTMWGDIAYQLGGVEAYQRVAEADLHGVSPGSDDLKALFEYYGPALIMVDELVAFARNLYGVKQRQPAGSFESIMTFMQALTEAVKRTSDAMLLVSVPESDIEIGGEGGAYAAETLSNIIGRVEAVWKPVTANESFEVVRRRLFNAEIDEKARAEVLAAFQQEYRSHSADYPSGVSEGDYIRRMQDAYPIHPELFDRLYNDWSSLDKFQRTRGVLRLMSAVIHRLWQNQDQSLLILPGSIPLWAREVREELLRYLPEGWNPIVDSDVDGTSSIPYLVDQDVPAIGKYAAARRVARTIFVGSAPSVVGQAVRGLEDVRIRLGAVQPGEPVGQFNDALRRMSARLTYLYSDGSRYWYDTRPTVNKMHQDRAQALRLEVVVQAAVDLVRAARPAKGVYAGYHAVPQSSADVVDEPRFRVVALPPDQTHTRSAEDTGALKYAREVLNTRGGSPRLYQNMLVFIAPDQNAAKDWYTALREALAWQSILDEADTLNLDAQQRKQVSAGLSRARETAERRLQETYSWLLVPVQPDPAGPVHIEAIRIAGEDSFYDRAWYRLRKDELVIPRWAPALLAMELDKYLWRNQPHAKVRQVWDDLARYCYLPRLASEDVLAETVQAGAGGAPPAFGYAQAVDARGEYAQLAYGTVPSVYMSESDVIIRADVAAEALERLQGKSAPPVPARHDDSEPAAGGLIAFPPEPARVLRYAGSVVLNPHRPAHHFGQIVDEVIQQLGGATGTDIQVTVEIRAERPDGFDEHTQRTVSENAATLKFGYTRFDKG